MDYLVQEIDLNILYEDLHIVAIHKPSGLLVHRSYLARKEKIFAMQLLRDKIGQHVYPVHRLDRPTSGVLLFAKSSAVARILNEQFAEHKVIKDYVALVRGYLQDEGVLDYPLKEELDKIADKKARQDKEAQSAITHYKPLLHMEVPFASGRYLTSRFTLVKLSPQTGRKHQLRRHMAHLRHPIIGDTTHGDGKQNLFFRELVSINRLWLCAYQIRLTHPITLEPLIIKTQLDAEFARIDELFTQSLSDRLDKEI